MGWLYQAQLLRPDTPVAYLRRQFTCDGERFRSTVLDAAAVRSTVYAAIRSQDRETGADYVFCAVILFRNNERDGFGYKDMTECMGPYEVDCPDRIMRLLSPVERIPHASYAADWHRRVAAAKENRRTASQVAAQLRPGVVVRLAREVRFARSGVVATAFRLRHFHRRTPIFAPVDHPNFLCRLPRQMLATATVGEPGPPPS